ncbi:hypothetical protein DE146DRAFT_711095 [Phaeosphaeria sp. MPI-PUGE-AT-0046c]|nr:hypothetical protein DE146DRAFT_711095 [Phaeosphaeria sp. MPI-PUGE-AT-0046c]
MATKAKTPAPPRPTTPERDSSPELGSPSKITQYNKDTGRPIRKSAGKVKKVAGYVDSSFLGDDYDPSSTEETDDEDMSTSKRGRADKIKRKRKRSPSPPSPQLDRIMYDQELDIFTDDESGGAFHGNTPKKPPVSLQFNVPLGFHGPLFVKLDSALLKDSEEGVRHDMHRLQTKKPRAIAPPSQPAAVTGSSQRFTDLSPELRNQVYRHLFVRRDMLNIPQHHGTAGLCQSSQFLRTCRLVHDEGCSILYGENEFHFNRHHDTRAPFWETKHKEIGYQDALHFLKMIGPENVQYLRDIQFDFDDALPKHAPLLSTEARRYVVDDYLMNCLRILRDAKLRKISLRFFGRRQLFKSDVKFLGYLEQIKADEVVKLQLWAPQSKISNWVWEGIKERMVRKKKLYVKK